MTNCEAYSSTSFLSASTLGPNFSPITRFQSTNLGPDSAWHSRAIWKAERSYADYSFISRQVVQSIAFDKLPWWMNPTTFSKSASFKPLVVSGVVPNRIPLGFRALLSPGTKINIYEWSSKTYFMGKISKLVSFSPVFLLTEMEMSSRIFSALDPLSFLSVKSSRTRWQSVPPVTIL